MQYTYRIAAQVVTTRDGWTSSTCLPIFEVQAPTALEALARAVRLAIGQDVEAGFHAVAYCEATGDYAARGLRPGQERGLTHYR